MKDKLKNLYLRANYWSENHKTALAIALVVECLILLAVNGFLLSQLK